MVEGKLQWHPAFAAVLRIEFEEEIANLDILEEHTLSKKPMQIDVLILKKEKKIPIKKNIGCIFRTYNLIEYKSPEDYLSINDFYKLLGYTCFYQSDTERVMEIDPAELTMTFVCSHYPRKMIQYIKKMHSLKITQQEAGIYYINNAFFPIQIIVTDELSVEENYWLQNLRNDLSTGEEIHRLMKNYEANRYSKWHQAVMDLIVRANWDRMKEEKEMCDALNELFAEELRESEEKGMEKGMEKGIQNLIETCQELKIRRQEVLVKLMEKYILTQQLAEAYLEKYWN